MPTREPLISTATAVAVVTAVIALLVAFGVGLNDDQRTAILGFTAVAVPLVTALLARSKVTPTADPRNDAGDRLVPADLPEGGSTFRTL